MTINAKSRYRRIERSQPYFELGYSYKCSECGYEVFVVGNPDAVMNGVASFCCGADLILNVHPERSDRDMLANSLLKFVIIAVVVMVFTLMVWGYAVFK